MGLFGLFGSKNREKSKNELVEEEMLRLHFPCGEEEIKNGVDTIERLLKGRLSRNECRDLYIKSKFYFSTSQYDSQSAMLPMMVQLAKGKISQETALEIFNMLGTVKEMYSRNGGVSPDDAIVIGAPSSYSCIVAQYAFLQDLYGERDVAWTLVERESYYRNSKEIESWKIRTKQGNEVVVWYDITNSMGKI